MCQHVHPLMFWERVTCNTNSICGSTRKLSTNEMVARTVCFWAKCGMCGTAGGVQLLAPILEGAATTGMAAPPNQQLLYDAGVATWELTFHEPAVKLMPPCGAAPLLLASLQPTSMLQRRGSQPDYADCHV